MPALRMIAATIALGSFAWWVGAPLSQAESARLVPPPLRDAAPTPAATETAVLAGGCFWGVQGVYQHVDGVLSAVSGYAGGAKDTAQYEQVGSGRTGHAESVRIVFEPRKVSYGQLLQIFFSVVHDPTQLNRQGPDVGTQYRSVIAYRDDDQKNVATAYIAQLKQAGVFARPIVTRVDPLRGFYPAESYHQDYLVHNPSNPYIAYNDLPKIENLKRLFPNYYSDHPVLLAGR